LRRNKLKIFVLHECQEHKWKIKEKTYITSQVFIHGVFTSERKANNYRKKHKEAKNAEISETELE